MILRISTALAFLFFFSVILCIGLQNPPGIFIRHIISQVPLGDKALHFLWLSALSLLLNEVLRKKRVSLFGSPLLLGSLCLAIGITLEECSQLFIPARHFEFLDMVCNYAGICAGSVICVHSGKILVNKGSVKPLV